MSFSSLVSPTGFSPGLIPNPSFGSKASAYQSNLCSDMLAPRGLLKFPLRFWVFNFGDYQFWQFWQSLCGPLPVLSAKTPTRLSNVLLKTKLQPQFDKAVIRLSTPLYCPISTSNLMFNRFLVCVLLACKKNKKRIK